MAQTNGEPVNTKSLLAFIFKQMSRLANHEIDNQEAMAQAKLASQASNLLNYELKRTLVQIKLSEIGGSVQSTKSLELRDIESKAFDDAKVD